MRPERASYRTLSGGAGDEGGDDVGGVPVEGDSSSVVTHGRARVRMTRGFLDVAQRDTGVEGSGDEGMAQRVRTNPLGDASSTRDAPHDPGGGVAVESLTARSDEDWSFAALADREIDRACGTRRERDDDHLAALAQNREVRWPRSRPSASMLAPMASETRRPFRASRLMSA
jgi:hypothetical protein